MKLTKAQTRDWDKIKGLLEGKKPLEDEEAQIFLDKFLPGMVRTDVSRLGAHFTPWDVARELTYWAVSPGDRVLDLAAGVGSLSRACAYYGDNIEVVAVELCHEFIEIGKRIAPEARWVQGSIYDQKLIQRLGKFDAVVSNPPYSIKVEKQDWLSYNGASELMAAEVALRAGKDATFIMPANSVPWHFDHMGCYNERWDNRHLVNFVRANPDARFSNLSVDMGIYKDLWKSGLSSVEMVRIHPREEGDELYPPLREGWQPRR
jgi:predicted RNA methylase